MISFHGRSLKLTFLVEENTGSGFHLLVSCYDVNTRTCTHITLMDIFEAYAEQMHQQKNETTSQKKKWSSSHDDPD